MVVGGGGGGGGGGVEGIWVDARFPPSTISVAIGIENPCMILVKYYYISLHFTRYRVKVLRVT